MPIRTSLTITMKGKGLCVARAGEAKTQKVNILGTIFRRRYILAVTPQRW